MDKSYWVYKWHPSQAFLDLIAEPPGPEAFELYFVEPLVYEETAHLAVRTAAQHLQRRIQPPEPIDPLHVRVIQVGLQNRWCVKHDQGSCALAMAKNEEGARWFIGADNVLTTCQHYVHEVEEVFFGVPSCELCLVRLIVAELFEMVRKKKPPAEGTIQTLKVSPHITLTKVRSKRPEFKPPKRSRNDEKDAAKRTRNPNGENKKRSRKPR